MEITQITFGPAPLVNGRASLPIFVLTYETFLNWFMRKTGKFYFFKTLIFFGNLRTAHLKLSADINDLSSRKAFTPAPTKPCCPLWHLNGHVFRTFLSDHQWLIFRCDRIKIKHQIILLKSTQNNSILLLVSLIIFCNIFFK